MCCSPSDFKVNQINGECADCGEPTVDNEAYENCYYSKTICETCGWSPCDEAC